MLTVRCLFKTRRLLEEIWYIFWWSVFGLWQTVLPPNPTQFHPLRFTPTHSHLLTPIAIHSHPLSSTSSHFYPLPITSTNPFPAFFQVFCPDPFLKFEKQLFSKNTSLWLFAKIERTLEIFSKHKYCNQVLFWKIIALNLRSKSLKISVNN